MNSSQATLLSSSAWTELIAKLEGNPACSKGWESFDRRMRAFTREKVDELEAHAADLRQRADAAEGVKKFSGGGFFYGLSKEMADLAFHHRVTQSPESRDAALRLTGLLMEWPYWKTQAATNQWKSDLFTADVSTAVALALMQLRSSLDEKTFANWATILRQRGVDPLYEEWIDPVHRIHALDTMGHNWWSVCVSGAALGLFASRELFADTDDRLRRIAGAFVEFFNYPGNTLQNKHRTFGRQGDFIESIGYLDYTLQHAVLVFDLYRDQFGLDLAARLPVLRPICDYYLSSTQTLEQKTYRLNFGDMGCERESLGRSADVCLWLANRFKNEPLFHLARRVQPEPASLLQFLFWPADLQGESFAGAPGDVVYDNIGVAILRDGYGDDSTLFAIKAGERWNHNQADACSFILSSGGRQFIIDSGAIDYSNPLYLDYFSSPEAHNVILPGRKSPDPNLFFRGAKFMGGIPTALFAPGYKYVLADGTGPWAELCGRYYRNVLWIGGFIVLIDDLMAHQAGPWTQLLHPKGGIVAGKKVTRIVNEGRELLIHHIFPDVQDIEQRAGSISHRVPGEGSYQFKSEVEETPYLAFHYAARERHEKFIQVIELPGQEPLQIEKLEAPRLSGIRIRLSGGSWEIFCNHGASDGSSMHLDTHVEFGKLHTNAYITALQRDTGGKLLSASFHNGSQVRLDESLLYSSLLKSDGLIRYSGQAAEIHSTLTASTLVDYQMPGSSASSPVKRVTLPAGTAVTSLA